MYHWSEYWYMGSKCRSSAMQKNSAAALAATGWYDFRAALIFLAVRSCCCTSIKIPFDVSFDRASLVMSLSSSNMLPLQMASSSSISVSIRSMLERFLALDSTSSSRCVSSSEFSTCQAIRQQIFWCEGHSAAPSICIGWHQGPPCAGKGASMVGTAAAAAGRSDLDNHREHLILDAFARGDEIDEVEPAKELRGIMRVAQFGRDVQPEIRRIVDVPAAQESAPDRASPPTLAMRATFRGTGTINIRWHCPLLAKQRRVRGATSRDVRITQLNPERACSGSGCMCEHRLEQRVELLWNAREGVALHTAIGEHMFERRRHRRAAGDSVDRRELCP